MTNPNMSVPDAAKILAYVAFVWLALRSLSACTFVFFGLNLEVCRVAAIQVQGRRTGCSSPGRAGSERANPTQRRTANSSSRLPSKGPQRAERHTPPPPPYSFSPLSPTSDSKCADPTSASLITLYEDIIASDAQTIQVQQETMASQQDIIRSQSQMIMKLRHLLEEQDQRIEELDEVARGLRVRRSGLDLAPRSRST
ncbi:hypothetical protein HBI56_124410 [Parastagonospora nodorum]|uniref:Uncharacterized protein n=1 Tax=Phaeosphaeria nodorum (strain SN15 / ATCC MYA-4574 / FGSC 10173) TaxID=321614 RepID=A0A7U2F4V8_PHANO|nr:hypothetical protein HBH56_165740 [Parastagonospora nodorum]QRC98511.1 hypothetical protein JI435_045650 [Parastagonospora nodorum SN15]KAH3936518.1 hypothetical protein HBH54_028830 [Parastagonospora nodorum]KAH3948177.1 hypothetical protein HBH53_103600 [Parastagonospora nodorum]KAH3968787.1 hypothetical protein HBH51_127500 [Parastagonospora nodorum]